jgi:hypothetical protein
MGLLGIAATQDAIKLTQCWLKLGCQHPSPIFARINIVHCILADNKQEKTCIVMDMEGVDIPDLDLYKIGKLVNSIASWSFSAAVKTCTGFF